MEKRLQKILSEMGIASRRKAEELILEGRVTVNGSVATLGTKADISRDHIKVGGKLLVRQEPRAYLMFNKPKNVVTSLRDPEGRSTVKDFLKGVKYRVFPVGRLDYDSEGLLLLTNDGDFANAVLHPSQKISKTYQVKVKGVPGEKELAKLKAGIKLEDGVTSPAKARILRTTESNSWLEITINEGKKRQIRRMLDATGHPVLKLKRVAIDGIVLGNLGSGEHRYLTQQEIARLKGQTTMASTSSRGGTPAKRPAILHPKGN